MHMALENFFKIEVESYKSTPEKRLKSKQFFLDVLKQVNYENDFKMHQETHDNLCKIINLIKN